MTYQRTLSQEVMTELQPIIDGMIILSSGENLKITGSFTQVKRIRYNLYAYLKAQDLKSHYRIKQLSSEEIMIIKKESTPQIVVSSKDSSKRTVAKTLPLSSKLISIFEASLLLLDDEFSVINKVQELINKKEITKEESLKLLAEWRRVQGF